MESERECFPQAAAEKVAKQLQHNLNEVQGKLDETNRTLNDFDAAKKKLSIENSDLLRQLEEAESQVSQLSKLKISLTTQLEDTKRLADEESRVSPFLQSIHNHLIVHPVHRFIEPKEIVYSDVYQWFTWNICCGTGLV